MDDFKQKVSRETIKLKNHLKQIPLILNIYEDIYKPLANLEFLSFTKYPELARLIVFRIMCSNLEVIRTLADSLKNKNFTSIEILSRASIEYSVNIIYILGDSESRPKEFINSYFSHHETKMKKWNNSNISNKLDTSFSSKITNDFHPIKETIAHQLNLKGHDWPKTSFEKFRKCGLENDYRTIYSSASNSVHLLSEDTFNYVLSYMGENKEIKEIIQNFHRHERFSFGLYMILHSFRFLINSMAIFLEDSNEYKTLRTLETSFNEVKKLIDLHDNEILEMS